MVLVSGVEPDGKKFFQISIRAAERFFSGVLHPHLLGVCARIIFFFGYRMRDSRCRMN